MALAFMSMEYARQQPIRCMTTKTMGKMVGDIAGESPEHYVEEKFKENGHTKLMIAMHVSFTNL
jgi:hypothetical protein